VLLKNYFLDLGGGAGLGGCRGLFVDGGKLGGAWMVEGEICRADFEFWGWGGGGLK
jgi:hypothetical protein